MTLLLQVSDPHFCTERAAVVQALERLAHALRPDVLLLSGDITQRARRWQFSRARAFVERLRVPAVVAISGNHDIPLFNLAARLFWPYANHRRAFGRDLEPEFGDDDVLVLAVNTTRWYRHVDGEVSAAQIERVAQRLVQARPALWRIVVLHQPVAVTCATDQHNVLHGHEGAVRRWAAAGADLVVGGPHSSALRTALARALDGPATGPLGSAGRHGGQRARAHRGEQFGERHPCGGQAAARRNRALGSHRRQGAL